VCIVICYRTTLLLEWNVLLQETLNIPILHTSLQSLIQPPNFQVPSVFVSSLESNFSCFLGLKTYYSKGDFCSTIFFQLCLLLFMAVTFTFNKEVFLNLINNFQLLLVGCCLVSGILLSWSAFIVQDGAPADLFFICTDCEQLSFCNIALNMLFWVK
jgi:hypothetical protein